MDSKQQSLVPGTVGTSGNDSSDLWFTLEPPKSRDDAAADAIVTHLRTATVAEDLEPLRAIALDGDGTRRRESARAALALARRLLGEDPEDFIDDTADTAHAWLWLAAHRGSVAATLLLVNALIEKAKTIHRDAKPKDAAARKRVQAHQALACGWFDRVLSIWLWEPKIKSLAQVIAEDLREPSLYSGPTRTVIGRWTLDHPGRDLAPYEVLAKPIPLAGGDRNLGAVTTQLRQEFPWMAGAIDRVADDLALCALGAEPWARIRPLLLVGPPGCGKSRFARRLAELIGTGCRVVGAGGSSDSRDLAGTAHGWANREPSAIIRLMKDCGAANPVVIVDEIDKAGGGDVNGDVRRSLLGMIEPETARRWYDECLQAHCDLSAVSWVFTANDLEPISRPMRSRLAVARVGLPGPDAIDTILDGMCADIAAELGLDPEILPDIAPPARRALADAIKQGRSLRDIKAALVRAMATGARQIRAQG